MSERETTFKDFKEKVNEILEHYSDIDRLDFNAELKNGTKFSFYYDDKTYDNKKVKKEYHPISVFNAVLDMIAAGIMIAFIVVLAVRSSFQRVNFALTVNTYIFFTIFFIISAVYHLFNVNSRARKPLYLVRFGFSMTSITLMTITLLVAADVNKSVYIFALLITALSFFFSSFGTKVGQRLSYLSYLADAILILVACERCSTIWGLSIALIVAGAIPLCLPSKFQKATTNGTFLLATTAFFFQFLLLLF